MLRWRASQSLVNSSLGTRLLVGGVLLAAAALKGTWSALVVAEVVLGLWVLSGWNWRIARRVAIAWMAALCCVSLYKIFIGQTSCGCFGKAHVHPAVTFALDLAMLGALVFSQPTQKWRRIASIATQCSVLIIAGLAIWWARPKPVAISMQPETWVGQPSWSLGEYTDCWKQISHGKWVVLLYDPDCRACDALRDSYEQLATTWRSGNQPQRVALIDPTLSAESPPPDNIPSEALYGVLRAPEGLYVPTPTLVLLIDGRVIQTDFGFDDCAWNDREFPDH